MSRHGGPAARGRGAAGGRGQVYAIWGETPGLSALRALGRTGVPPAYPRCRSRGRASARPMGFPPPLVPHITCEPRLPVAHRAWDWAVCRNALWVNRLWSAIYLFRSWGLDRSLPRYLLARRQERCYTAHRSPVPGGPLRCVTRIGPPKGTLTSSTHYPSLGPCLIGCLLRGAVCSPNLRSPKTRTPSTFRGRLMSARRPHSRPLPQAIVVCRS
jgi:hypothetical protein